MIAVAKFSVTTTSRLLPAPQTNLLLVFADSRQLGDVHCDPVRLILAEQLGGGTPAWLILEI